MITGYEPIDYMTWLEEHPSVRKCSKCESDAEIIDLAPQTSKCKYCGYVEEF